MMVIETNNEVGIAKQNKGREKRPKEENGYGNGFILHPRRPQAGTRGVHLHPWILLFKMLINISQPHSVFAHDTVDTSYAQSETRSQSLIYREK